MKSRPGEGGGADNLIEKIAYAIMNHEIYNRYVVL
jgi:hypothetical protein